MNMKYQRKEKNHASVVKNRKISCCRNLFFYLKKKKITTTKVTLRNTF